MGGKDIAICLKKGNKDEKNIKKIIARQKSLSIIMNKVVFSLRFNNMCYLFSYTLLNPYIYVILDRLTEIKA